MTTQSQSLAPRNLSITHHGNRVRISRGIDLRAKDNEVEFDTVFVNRMHTLVHIVYAGHPDSWMRIKLPQRKGLRVMHDTLFEAFIIVQYKRFL